MTQPPHIMAPQDMPSHIGFAPIESVNTQCRNGATYRRLRLADGPMLAGQTRSSQLEFSILVTTNPPLSRSTLNRILSPGLNPVSIAGSLTRKIMIMDSM